MRALGKQRGVLRDAKTGRAPRRPWASGWWGCAGTLHPFGAVPLPAHNGGVDSGPPRRRTPQPPREKGTVWLALNRVRPALLAWSTRYDHLREVTREDVLTHLNTLHGHHRRDQLVALRSLFFWAKRSGLVFRNPTNLVKIGQSEYAVLQPLLPTQVDRSVAACTTPHGQYWSRPSRPAHPVDHEPTDPTPESGPWTLGFAVRNLQFR